jgi:hypothetical protein
MGITKLFNMDLHISVIADFKNLLPEFEVTDWCMSGHSWVFERSQECPNHINPATWINIDEEMIRAFQEEYDEFLKGFDGFICGHPNGLIPVFEKYGKPIIMINSCRYDLPFCWSRNGPMLQSYKDCLHRLNQRGLLRAVSNNLVDQLYTKLGCGIEPTHIPSLCAYTGMKYNPTRGTFLWYSDNGPTHPLITNKKELGTPFKWSDISEFRGIIHFPYEVSTMSMFEHYSAGMPLFFPSKELLIQTRNLITVRAYWNEDLPTELAPFSDIMKWIDLADYYAVFKSPNVYVYSSFEHLIELLEGFQWKDDKDILNRHREDIRKRWIDVLSK